MRWDNLRIDAEEERRLPGHRDPAVVRRFDAPEALDVRFYEVHAKSALNKVPAASMVPFRWTVNPYRGCTHACVYCLGGDTPILMADGRTRALSELQIGDRVYGTVRDGHDRRYAVTRVQAQWSTVKPAYRVALEDGTELIASGDHRFLTEHGWKHVTGSEEGRGRRPRLTVGDALLGTGHHAAAPDASDRDYRRGYLCGIIRGDGHLGSYSYSRPGRTHGAFHRFRLATTDVEALDRARNYPLDEAVATDELVFAEAVGSSRGMIAVRASARDRVERVSELIRWPLAPSDGCRKGFTRTRSLEGLSLTSTARLGVVAVEPLGVDLRLFDITTGTGDFIANGVVSHNCFARPTHRYLDLDAGRDFEREIVVKVNVPEVLRAELAKPSWSREHVAMGTNTDPYQWVESKYRLMPGIWEAFRDSATPCSVLTKSPLVLRDLPLLEAVAERTEVSANLSVPTLDEKAWRATEPHTPHPRARLEAVAELNRAGIPSGILIAPLMPGINDAPEQVERILKLADEAGAVSVGGIALHLRGDVRGVFFDWLRSKRPDLLERYERLYARGAYAPREERQRLAGMLKRARPGHRAAEGAAGRFGSRRIERRDQGDDGPSQPGASRAGAQGRDGIPEQPSLF